MFGRIAAFVYGVCCYVLFLASLLYAIGFIGNFWVPKSIDSGAVSPFLHALGVDAVLLTIFAVQHSVMARPWFKAVWTRIVPKVIERSTYVLFASAALLLLFWKWEPLGGVMWEFESAPVRYMLGVTFALGWMTVLVSTFLINHFDLFGLRQVWLNLVGRRAGEPKFKTPGLYKHVRHPLYLGFLMAFWSAPVMSETHLVFALATTAYILIAIQFEERDLGKVHREYAEYKQRVPMILPTPFSTHQKAAEAEVVDRAS